MSNVRAIHTVSRAFSAWLAARYVRLYHPEGPVSELGGADIELVKSSGGVFEITLDGDLVFSKKATGRFPKWKEVESIAARA